MLVWLNDWLYVPGAESSGLIKITLRAALAAMASFTLALFWGPRLIAWLRVRYRERVVTPSAGLTELHRDKQATPTMGGLFLVAGLCAALAVFGDLSNPFIGLALMLVIGLAWLGAWDDLTKLTGDSPGISPAAKLAGQTLIAAAVSFLLYEHHRETAGALDLVLPLVGERLQLGWLFVPLSIIVIVGSSNAVNLADGLDGLAGGCLIFCTAAMAVAAYAAGHVEMARYLGVTAVPGAGEMLIVAAAMIGAVLGFLWFNCHPAQVFMGDTGSLPLGGLLGLMAVVARQELLLVVVGGVFVAEAVSVIVQVAYFKLRGRRLLRCAPLHHHFQFLGWPENKIVVRFWIASALCAVLGIAALKFNVYDGSPLEPSSITAAEGVLRR